jgi:hypothetical protein
MALDHEILLLTIGTKVLDLCAIQNLKISKRLESMNQFLVLCASCTIIIIMSDHVDSV